MKVLGLFCCMNIKTHSRKFAGKSAFVSCYKVKALYNFAKRMRLIMKRFHRRCRRLCILAALLVLLVLFLRQNVLLDTASRHAILLDAQSGQVLAQKRADERTAPASLTKMMTVLLAIETESDLDKQVTLPEDIFPALQTEKASMAGFGPMRLSRCVTCSMVRCCPPAQNAVRRWHSW